MPTSLNRRQCLSLAGLPLLPSMARSQGGWPQRTIRWVVPLPAGGAPDLLARLLAEQLSKQLGQSVIVDNKPGASGLLGARVVSQASPDGYTMAYSSSALVTLQAMNPSFNFQKELKPVSRLSSSPFACVVAASSPFKTLQDLIKHVQANPDKLSYGSAGNGSPAHMAVAYLEEKLSKFKALHVPFKGAVESINAILGGQIDFSIALLGTAMPHLTGGKLRALAVSSDKRLEVLPDVPTMAEAGVPGYRYEAWGGLAFPAGTPDEIIDRVFQQLPEAVNAAPVRALVAKTGSYLELSASPKAFAEQIAREVALEGPTVRRLGLV